jgi:cobalt-zinc-cadmium efflux system membrane fusion protein
VFVRRDATRFEAREIGVGKAVDGYTEVTGGLKRGEPIVRQGSFHLKSVLIGKELGEEE